jgi:hypothetical protein
MALGGPVNTRVLIRIVAALIAVNLTVPLVMFLAHHRFTHTVHVHDRWACPGGYHVTQAVIKDGPNAGDILISCKAN